MQLFWTKKTQIQSKTSDPLGFTFRIRVPLFDILFLGLTNPVTRAKYYILYPKFIQSLEKFESLKILSLLKLERAYLIAAYEHSKEEFDKDHSGILGINSISRISDERLREYNFKIFENNQSGFNRLRGNLAKIGLIRNDSNENNELKVKLTSLGYKIANKQFFNPNSSYEILIKDFKESECLCKLSDQEQVFLRHVFTGDFKVETQQKGEYNIIPSDSVEKSFDILNFLRNLEVQEEFSFLTNIRHHSLIYILSIFNKLPEDFISELIEDCFSSVVDEYVNIRQLWRFYFLVCGFQEVCELTLFLINEILKNKWNGIENQEATLSFKELQLNLKEDFAINSKIKYGNFPRIIREAKEIINNIGKNNEKNLKKIPNLIKVYYGILWNHFKNEKNELVRFIINLDSPVTSLTLDSFLKYYEINKNLEENQFVFIFFKDFCLLRQKNINQYRNYRGKERALLFDTENEIVAQFSKSDVFKPSNVLDQFKLTNNLIKILNDLGLIFENKLTKDVIELLKRYHE